jgi:ParB family chromosome partitioning protein
MVTANKLAYVGSTPEAYSIDRDSDSWYTPIKYIEDARIVFGGEISLDPFTSIIANEQIKAVNYYTLDDDALNKEWITTGVRSVWINPPYGKTMSKAIDKFLSEYDKKSFSQAILLCNNGTDTRWFKKLAEKADSFCFTDHRIQFEAFDGKKQSTNTRGQCFIYYGPDIVKFSDIFSRHGLILSKI